MQLVEEFIKPTCNLCEIILMQTLILILYYFEELLSVYLSGNPQKNKKKQKKH